MANEVTEEKNQKEGEIIRDATVFSATLYVSQALYMVRGFIIARVLGPSAYGVWSIFRTFLSSSPYLGLGVQQAMVREIPLSLGEGDGGKVPVITQTSLFWNLLVTSCVMVIAFILSLTPLIKEYYGEVRLAGFVFMLNSVYLFIQSKLKGEKNIILLSKYIFSYAVLNTVFVLSLLFFLKIQGILLGMMISHLILFTVIVLKGHLSFQLMIDRKVLWKLINIGFPIMMLWSIFFLMRNADKFIVIAMLGKTMAGYYGVAAFISSIVSYISYSVTTVLLPRMMYKYGETREAKNIEAYYTKPIIILTGFIPIILGIIYINIDIIVKSFLPQYLPSINVLHILIASLFFSTIWGIPANLLIALNKQRMFMYITAGVLLFTILLDIVVIQIGFGMRGVAVCTTFMFLVASVIANSLALLSFENSTKQIWRKLGIIYFPFVYSLCGLLIIIMTIQISGNIVMDNIVKSLAFITFSIPLILYTEKKSNVISKTFTALKIFKKNN
jgi:O-antigen/teichoic acid export membrane protein